MLTFRKRGRKDSKDRKAHASKGEGSDPRSGDAQVLQVLAQDEPQAPVEPYFPSSEEATELNKEAHAQDRQEWAGLVKPNELESAINRAQQHWYYGDTEQPDPEERLATAGAKMAYGIGMNQPFANGNKRTALWLTRHFLDQNGLGHIMPYDQEDEEFADHLLGHGEGTHSEQDTSNLLVNRLRGPQQIQSNILDPIHDELDPSVWDDPASNEPRLRQEHLHFIHDFITKTLKEAGYTHMEVWLSFSLTGSLTTYQYSPQSDCDVSLFVDAEKFPEWSRAEMIGLMVEKCDGVKLAGTTHDMQCFVVARGMAKTDLYKPGLRSAYDLQTQTWIVPPERDRVHDVEKEMNEAYTIALESADKMERLLRYEPDKAVMFWHQIHKRRMRDQKAGRGDYSPSNIVYKFLANRGLFPAISEVSGEYIA